MIRLDFARVPDRYCLYHKVSMTAGSLSLPRLTQYDDDATCYYFEAKASSSCKAFVRALSGCLHLKESVILPFNSSSVTV
jgi:hypothetical protein